MELCTTIPARKDGTVTVPFAIGGGKTKLYVFTGEPLACEVDDEAHAAKMIGTGNFMSREDYEDEMDLARRMMQRAERQKAAGQVEAAKKSAALASGALSPGAFVPGLGEGAANPGDEDEDAGLGNTDPNAQPEEAGTRPTGRVRKAQK
ncbi:MAG: hypothetical protein RR800_00590 [Comamonas sp.]